MAGAVPRHTRHHGILAPGHTPSASWRALTAGACGEGEQRHQSREQGRDDAGHCGLGGSGRGLAGSMREGLHG